MRINNIILSENMPVESNVLWIKPDEKGYTLLVNGSNGYVPLMQDSNSSFFDKFLTEFGILYNQDTGFYELNGLTDLTEDDIITILAAGLGKNINVYMDSAYTGSAVRTNLPAQSGTVGAWRPIVLTSTFSGCRNLEVARFANTADGVMYVSNLTSTFNGCTSLREISPIICTNVTDYTNTFSFCTALEEVRLQSVKANISFSRSPHISLESLNYLIEYSANISAIEIAVHPNVYAKIQDTSNTEWHKLIEDGAAKQISFVNGTSALDFNELEL